MIMILGKLGLEVDLRVKGLSGIVCVRPC
jgi:hypothetical protein